MDVVKGQRGIRTLANVEVEQTRMTFQTERWSGLMPVRCPFSMSKGDVDAEELKPSIATEMGRFPSPSPSDFWMKCRPTSVVFLTKSPFPR